MQSTESYPKQTELAEAASVHVSKEKFRIDPKVLWALDYLVVTLVFWLIYEFRVNYSGDMGFPAQFGARENSDLFWAYVSSFSVLIVLFRSYHLYKHKVVVTRAEHTEKIIRGFIMYSLCVVLGTFIFSNSDFVESARGYLIGVVTLGIPAVMLERLLVRYFAKRFVSIGNVKQMDIVVIGSGNAARLLLIQMRNNPLIQLRKVFILDDNQNKIGDTILGFPVIGTPELLKDFEPLKAVHEIYIVMNNVKESRLIELIELGKQSGIHTNVLSSYFDKFRFDHSRKVDFQGDVFQFAKPKFRYVEHWSKRTFDIAMSSLALAVLLVPFSLVALLIKLTSKGPILYTSIRVGKDLKPFNMFKFRTMVLNNETKHKEIAQERLKQGKHMGKVKDDPRITAIGKILRKFSLDELPQLLNVLKGDMSIVGPRPCFKYELELFDNWHKLRFNVKPGLTGMWQVSGRHLENLDLNQSMIMDVYYVQNHSFWLDLRIIFKTLPVVFLGKGK